MPKDFFPPKVCCIFKFVLIKYWELKYPSMDVKINETSSVLEIKLSSNHEYIKNSKILSIPPSPGLEN